MSWPVDLICFIDENLGPAVFPGALRSAGIAVEILADHFDLGARDIDWIPPASGMGWLIITHDRDIRYNRQERDAVMRNGGRVIIIRASGTRAEMAQTFLDLREQIIDFLGQNPAPFIARLHRDRIEMWLSRDDWTP